MANYVMAIDQGTTSTRAIVFDHSGSIVSSGQLEHEQILPRAGWVEHDPAEIWRNTREVVGQALARPDIDRSDIAAVGITNQRETTVVWDKKTGEPVYNAIVWQDTRTQKIVDELGGAEGAEKYKKQVGLPLATYFAGPKIKWILDKDRKSTRLNSSHVAISYAVFCLKKKKKTTVHEGRMANSKWKLGMS